MTIDFTKTAERLRTMLAQAPVQLVPTLRHATWEVETELAVQAVVYLFDHMRNRDQFVAAARLLAWSLPVSVQTDSRIVALVERAADDATRNETPEAELLDACAGALVMPLAAAKEKETLAGRASYWLSVVRLTRAKTALEYGCGCGLNVFHCAQFEGAVNWWGIDESEEQIQACTQQAKQLDLPVAFVRGETPPSVLADSVAVLHVLEHTAHPEVLLERAERYCVPGGTVTVVLPAGPWSLAIPPGKPLSSHVNVMSLGELMALVQSRGRLLDAKTFPEGPSEPGAVNAAVTYELGAR